jgi:hypothetical protein
MFYESINTIKRLIVGFIVGVGGMIIPHGFAKLCLLY